MTDFFLLSVAGFAGLVLLRIVTMDKAPSEDEDLDIER